MKMTQSRHSWAVFGYLPVIESGLRDAFKPAGITALMLFFIFMYFALKAGKSSMRQGLLFLLGLLLGKVYALGGLFDVFFRNRFFWLFMELSYIIFTVFLLALGFVLFRDWWVLRQKENYGGVIIKAPFEKFIAAQDIFEKGDFRRTRGFLFFLKAILLALLPFGYGLVAALIVSAFPEDANVLYIFYEASLPGTVFSVLALAFIYAFFFAIFLSFFFLFIWLILRNKHALQNLKAHFTIVQIFFSAVFMAYGFGMLVLIIYK